MASLVKFDTSSIFHRSQHHSRKEIHVHIESWLLFEQKSMAIRFVVSHQTCIHASTHGDRQTDRQTHTHTHTHRAHTRTIFNVHIILLYHDHMLKLQTSDFYQTKCGDPYLTKYGDHYQAFQTQLPQGKMV